MDKKRFTSFLVLALSISLAAGCASPSDVTRSDGALTGASQGASLAFAFGAATLDDQPKSLKEQMADFAGAAVVTLVTLPVFMLVGAATGALSVRK